MEDLAGIDWSKSTSDQPKPPPMNPTFSSLRPTPSPFSSGRNTPLSAQPLSAQPSSGSGSKPIPQKAAADSFSNLVNFGPAKSKQTLSLAERQAQLEAEKRQKAEQQRRQVEQQFGNGQFWDNLGSRGSNASPAPLQPPHAATTTKNEDDDLFAAFNKDTKVDNSSHYPPPESSRSTPANNGQLDLSDPGAWGSASGANGSSFPVEDDDPFGLSEMKPSHNSAPKTVSNDDDDFLGDLGRPVDEVRRKQAQQPRPGRPIEEDEDSSSSSEAPKPAVRQQRRTADDPFDRAVAQLVDYGFSADDARRALTESGAGTNTEAAVNWLLDEAHRKSKAASAGRSSSSGSQHPQKRDSRSPAQGDHPDLAKSAAAVGNSLFKTANSLWKTGQKKMQQAVADFQQDGDPSQPKWMRDAQMGERQQPRRAEASVTDEAMMLESGGRPKPARTTSRQAPEERLPPQRGGSPAQAQPSRSSPVPRWQQQSAPPAARDPRSRLNKLAADDDIATYSSPNRRKKAATPPIESKPATPEPDLLFGDDAPQARQTLPSRPAVSAPPRASPQLSSRPSPSPKPTPRPARQVPNISPTALQTSTRLRHEGTTHFKRGDYASAHSSYSSSLSGIPDTHPLAIVLLTNRALTALKTGEPKQAVSDADAALKIIGPGKGQGETVAVQGENGQDEHRDMKDLYGKALSRKAEALEQMEKWSDALSVWQICVEGGVGGATAVKGRQRCQTALAPKPTPAAKASAAAVKPKPKPRPVATSAPQKSSEAVTRLREANQAAAKEDDEKFLLSEKVDARVGAWRDGKRDNLRALLGSMDQVLWEGSGWKKIGMHELVMANKVKIQYMKAIAKTHPDKLPQDASTEVRLIAGLVFSTLNESWDKFKKENNL
ncbi:hypothetical protein NLU13_9554 [Sarocladium strictum]|uniref:UBA domain-containing protein n=1 Tax=Sarocladium strictum TaxID=5046 RepID=A0AA39L4A8_SARSR|nr:hypothetical protein NLU13_9554 [Sarocladium strictum]